MPGTRSGSRSFCEPGLCEIRANEETLSCFGCKVEFHIKCTGLNDEAVKSAKNENLPGLHWFCTACEEIYIKAFRLPSCKNCLSKTNEDTLLKDTVESQSKDIKAIQDKMSKIVEHLESFNKLQTEIDKSNASLSNVAESLNKYEENQKSWAEAVANKTKTNEEEIMKNITSKVINTQFKISQDRQERENNIMVFNIKEEEKDRKSQEIKDNSVFEDLCREVLELEPPKEVKLYRIGPYIPERIRPIKVIFSNTWDKRKFWSKLYKLKDSKYNQITIKHDMNEEDRKTTKSLLTQAYKQNQEEKPDNFLYKVRGPPWSQKIVKVFQKN